MKISLNFAKDIDFKSHVPPIREEFNERFTHFEKKLLKYHKLKPKLVNQYPERFSAKDIVLFNRAKTLNRVAGPFYQIKTDKDYESPEDRVINALLEQNNSVGEFTFVDGKKEGDELLYAFEIPRGYYEKQNRQYSITISPEQSNVLEDMLSVYGIFYFHYYAINPDFVKNHKGKYSLNDIFLAGRFSQDPSIIKEYNSLQLSEKLIIELLKLKIYPDTIQNHIDRFSIDEMIKIKKEFMPISRSAEYSSDFSIESIVCLFHSGVPPIKANPFSNRMTGPQIALLYKHNKLIQPADSESKGKVFALVAPTCSGKTTLINHLKNELGVKQLKKYTTRPYRSEMEKFNRHIISESSLDFQEKYKIGDIVAAHDYYGHKYGLDVHELAKVYAADDTYFYDTADISSALELQKSFPGLVELVMVLPPVNLIEKASEDRLRELLASQSFENMLNFYERMHDLENNYKQMRASSHHMLLIDENTYEGMYTKVKEVLGR